MSEGELHARRQRHFLTDARLRDFFETLFSIVECQLDEVFEHFDVVRIHGSRINVHPAAFMLAAHRDLYGAVSGFTVYGAVNSPYVWCRTPEGMGSWEFFDLLLTKANIITTPGAGFGPSGEGYIRLTAFGDAEATVEAMERIKALEL